MSPERYTSLKYHPYPIYIYINIRWFWRDFWIDFWDYCLLGLLRLTDINWHWLRSTNITAVYALKICNQFVLNTSCFRESHTSKFKFCNNYSNISCKKTLIKLDFKNRLYLYQNLNKNECSPTWSVFVIRRFLSASNGGFCNWSWVEETYFMTLVNDNSETRIFRCWDFPRPWPHFLIHA